jgi:NADPH-dependent 2,4-dienoyl-CoA reductase/sulfur reductase-like enzyme/nitrite reductase/ring-hydroxylating ferredoxin subunit
VGDHAERPEGPDLAAGIAADLITEGGLLAGRVGDEAVLLARVHGRCFAVGAKCMHYGGPLAEGLIVGDTIRCPWHHTAFNLATAEVERPPALDDLPRWNVEEHDGRIRVTGRAAGEGTAHAEVRRSRGQASAPESVAIIGAGAAGVVAADTLRREGYEGPISIVDDDRDAPVDRPNLSKDYLAGSAPEEWVSLRPADFFRDRGIDLHLGRRTSTIDVRNRRVKLDDGAELRFGALLLATGASPVQLPIPMSDRLPLRTLRSLADSRTIIADAKRAGPGGRAVVIGASFIGLEVAASLRARNLEVHVVAPEARPLERVLGTELAALVQRVHEEHGVAFHLGAKPVAIEGDQVILDSGERLQAQVAVAGVGVRPNVDLAARAGLAVDRGVLVNEYLETDASGVFAAGDVARWPDARTGAPIRIEHWVVAERQGQTAARNMLGAREPFTAVPFFWSAHYDLVINYAGHAESWDTIDVGGNLAARDAAVSFRADGHTLAVATVGRDRALLEAELAMEQEVAGVERAR